MPTVSIYIRQDDWEAWRKLKKPSEFIHNALNPRDFSSLKDIVDDRVYIAQAVNADEPKLTNFSKPIITPTLPATTEEFIKAVKDIPPLKRDDPDWEGPIFKKGKKK